MAIYTVTLRGLYYGQQIINTFAYVSAGTGSPTPSAFDLLNAMGFIPSGDPPALPDETIFAFIRGLVNNNMAFTEVEARNLYSVTDFYLFGYSPAVVGLIDGIDVSPMTAYGLRSNRVRTDIRRGFKRFCGVVEEATTNGGFLVGGYITTLADVADAMSEVLEGTFEATYQPSILSYEMYTVPPAKPAYRPYETEEEQLEHAAIGVTWAGYDTVRSQVSRQYGRGA